jgi:hypothetical protein
MTTAPQPDPSQDEPYPGLRPFEVTDASIFFGRDAHTAEVLARLRRHRFLGVVGASGGGKSSLVRAGLLPALYRGYLSGSTTHWRIAVMRPGGAPLAALATALVEGAGIGRLPEALDVLRGTTLGLTELVSRAGLRTGESLLVVVDQFEELFRSRGDEAQRDERQHFVSLLLGAVESAAHPIYVVLTMRYDYFGDCADFPGLPEALNASQYLVPRLTREQRQSAIEEPLRLAGVTATARLVQTVLNESRDLEARDGLDSLPLLQHALLRTYRVWQERGAEGPLDLGHYDAAGRVSGAIDRHANELYRQLTPADQALCERVFRALTTIQSGRKIRRPRRLADLCAITGGAPERVAHVVRSFAARPHCLLVTSPQGALGDGTVVDIAHESLIPRWSKLFVWVDEEARSADVYQDLARDALRLRAHPGGLWQDADLLKSVRDRLAAEGWNRAWADQYWPEEKVPFAEAQAFLDASDRSQKAERERQKQVERLRQRLAVMVAAAVVLAVALAVAFAVFRGREKLKKLEAAREKQELLDQATANYARITSELNTRLEKEQELQKRLAELQAGSQTTQATDEIKVLRDQLQSVRIEADRNTKSLDQLRNSETLKTSEAGRLAQQVSDLQRQLKAALDENARLSYSKGDRPQQQQQSQEPSQAANEAELTRLRAQLQQLSPRCSTVEAGSGKRDFDDFYVRATRGTPGSWKQEESLKVAIALQPKSLLGVKYGASGDRFDYLPHFQLARLYAKLGYPAVAACELAIEERQLLVQKSREHAAEYARLKEQLRGAATAK